MGTKSIESLRVKGAEQLPVSVATSSVVGFLNEPTVDLALLDALEQFEDQATNRLLPSALEGCEDPGTTQ